MVRIITLLLIFLAIFSTACSTSTEVRYFSMPAGIAVVDDILCSDGVTKSFAAFVADNTKAGAVLKKINGCTASVDGSFSDKNPIEGTPSVDYGIYIGGQVSAIDILKSGDNYLVGLAIPGTKILNIKTLDSKLAYVRTAAEPSVALDFEPYGVFAFKDYFIVTGNDFNNNTIAAIDIAGNLLSRNVTFVSFNYMFCGIESCFTIDKKSGDLYTINDSLEPLLLDKDKYDLKGVFFNGASKLDDSRFAVWSDDKIFIFSSAAEISLLNTIKIPGSFDVTSSSAVSYLATKPYILMTQDRFFEKITVERDDIDAATATDGDAISGDSDTINNESEVSDDDTVSGTVGPSWDIFNASNNNIIWIALGSGMIIGYDITNDGWLAKAASDGTSSGVSLNPVLHRSKDYYPENGATNIENAPVLKDLTVIRGLPYSLSYEVTYEALLKSSASQTGSYNTAESNFYDPNADFISLQVADGDRILLTKKRNSTGCVIPFTEVVEMSVTKVVDKNNIIVDAGKWASEIDACFGKEFSYGVYPYQKYLVRKIDYRGNATEYRAAEFPVAESPIALKTSYSDGDIDFLIKRTTDLVTTERGTQFRMSFSPGISYVGINAGTLVKKMISLKSGNVLVYSPYKSMVLQYSPDGESLIKSYQ